MSTSTEADVAPASRYVLVCHRGDGKAGPSAEFTYWSTRQQAAEALAVLTPCSARCCGAHTICQRIERLACHMTKRSVAGRRGVAVLSRSSR